MLILKFCIHYSKRMQKAWPRLLGGLSCVLCCSAQIASAAGARLFKSGPAQITAEGAFLWVANEDNDSISRINTATDGVSEFPLPTISGRHSPRGLSIKEDGSEVW